MPKRRWLVIVIATLLGCTALYAIRILAGAEDEGFTGNSTARSCCSRRGDGRG